MTSFARYKPFYASYSIRNNGFQDPPLKEYNVSTTPDNFINATITTQYNAPIVDKASDFLVAVERMEINVNGVPFYDGGESVAEQITVRSRQDTSLEFKTDPLIQSAYSLSHLFEILNTVEFKDPFDDSSFGCTFSITRDGFVVVTLIDTSFNSVQLEFPRRLNMILGISTANQFIDEANPWVECQSEYPRIDLGDDLDHLILVSSLPTNADALGNVHLPVLTDFSVPSSYSNSLSYAANGTLVKAGFTTNIRQKIIYTPNERRYLELIGDFPIQDVEITAYYLSVDGIVKHVVLPLGAGFELKLGFYLKQ